MTLRDPSTLSIDEIITTAPAEGHTYIPPIGYVGLLWCDGACYSKTPHERIPVPEDGIPGVWLECAVCGREEGPRIQEVDPLTGIAFPHGQTRVVPAYRPDMLREAADEARSRAFRLASRSGMELGPDGRPRPQGGVDG